MDNKKKKIVFLLSDLCLKSFHNHNHDNATSALYHNVPNRNCALIAGARGRYGATIWRIVARWLVTESGHLEALGEVSQNVNKSNCRKYRWNKRPKHRKVQSVCANGLRTSLVHDPFVYITPMNVLCNEENKSFSEQKLRPWNRSKNGR
jgi:hypothetical protein